MTSADDPAAVAADDQLVEDLRAGATPPTADQVASALAVIRADALREPLRPISGWIEDRTEPSGWRWVRDLAALEPGIEDLQAMPAVHSGPVVYAGFVDWPSPTPRAPAPDVYRYTDPVDDPQWPGITEATDDDVPDAFPHGWGAAPTERDQAAIDAGNA